MELWEGGEEEKCSRTVLAENAADYTVLKVISPDRRTVQFQKNRNLIPK